MYKFAVLLLTYQLKHGIMKIPLKKAGIKNNTGNDTCSIPMRKSDHGTAIPDQSAIGTACVFLLPKRRKIMPRNQFERFMFALMTLIVTVHAYVFYSLYVINGDMFLQQTGAHSVLEAIHMQGGIPVLGRMLPIWAVVLIEFLLAFTLETVIGSPCSFRLACKVFDPRETHPVLFESAIICATVGLMCPAMSLIAAVLYYPYQFMDFNIFTFLANWLELVCYNFLFAFFTQLFFIQPLIRTLFKAIFRRSEQSAPVSASA